MKRHISWMFASLLAISGATLSCDGGFADADGDGFTEDVDCNDSSAEAFPGGVEECICDGLDNDCNGEVDDFPCPFQCYPEVDADGDGIEPPSDCNDSDPAVFPGAEEPCVCDDIDQDCSGDPWDFACGMNCFPDDDNDGFTADVDCDDDDGGINPGADEPCACDDVDQDCSGEPQDFSCALVCEDVDGDGFFTDVDCDDTDENIFPSNDPEACACDAIDTNCNDMPDDFDAATCTKTCTYLAENDACMPGMDAVCDTGLACCTMVCVPKCVGAGCNGDCPP